jgi:hypothetical protein
MEQIVFGDKKFASIALLFVLFYSLQSEAQYACPKKITCNCANAINTLTVEMGDGQGPISRPGDCACGRQTKNGQFEITHKKPRGAIGTYLPVGTPLIETIPPFCDACYIHTGGTSPGTMGIGCLHLTSAYMDLLSNGCENKHIELNIEGAIGGNDSNARFNENYFRPVESFIPTSR